MINDIISIFSLGFMQRALFGGILISLCCALLGVILVLKRFSMIGDGLSHIAFGALAIATALGFSPMYFTIPIVIIAAFLLLKLKDSSNIKGDSAIAMISISSLAIGIIFISYTSGGNTDVYNYMFGSILALTEQDIVLITILSSFTIIMYILTYNKMFLVAFDEKFAKSTGTNTDFYNMTIALLSAIVIVIGMKMMGAMLISALIIFPALTTMRIFRTFKTVIISSAVLSVINFSIGMFLSVILNTPTGASIVVIDVIMFVIFTLIGKLLHK